MKHTLRLVTGCVSFLLPVAAFAAKSKFTDFGGMMDAICETLPFCGEGPLIVAHIAGAITRTVLPLVALAAIASIAYAGVKIVMSGDESGITEAKKIILTAAIGGLLALSAAAIAAYLYSKIIPAAGG